MSDEGTSWAENVRMSSRLAIPRTDYVHIHSSSFLVSRRNAFVRWPAAWSAPVDIRRRS